MELGFKQLEVWNKVIDFVDSVIDLMKKLNTQSKHYRLIEQVEACSVSVSANIAEGKGRNSNKEFIQFLYIARGSLYETISFLWLFEKRKWITKEQLNELEIAAVQLAAMIKGLINATAKNLK